MVALYLVALYLVTQYLVTLYAAWGPVGDGVVGVLE